MVTSLNLMSHLSPEFPGHPHPEQRAWEARVQEPQCSAANWRTESLRTYLCLTHRENKYWQGTKKEHVLQTIRVT